MKFSVFKTSYCREPYAEMQLSEYASIVADPQVGGRVFMDAAEVVKQIRETNDVELQKKLKQKLPAISPGAHFGCNRQDVVNYTGLMQIDIDKGITDPELLRDELGRKSWVVFSSLSVRRGVWFLVRIPEPNRQELYWSKINAWLTNKYNLFADPSRKNPKDLRFYAPDNAAILNIEARTLPQLDPDPEPQSYHHPCIEPQKCLIKDRSTDYISPLDDFNKNADVLELLVDNGWKISHKRGNKIRLTRPGKSNGTSADWDESLRRLYVFTSNSDLALEDSHHALSPVDILMRLENICSTHEVRRLLAEKGYGRK